MAGSEEAVNTFLAELRQKVTAAGHKEYARLVELKRKHLTDQGEAVPDDVGLNVETLSSTTYSSSSKPGTFLSTTTSSWSRTLVWTRNWCDHFWSYSIDDLL